MGHSPRGDKELDRTEQLSTRFLSLLSDPPSPLRLEDSLCLSSCHPGLPGSGVKATSQDGGFFQEAA